MYETDKSHLDIPLPSLFPEGIFDIEEVDNIDTATARNTKDILEDETCFAATFVIDHFNVWSGKQVTRYMLLASSTLRMQLGYYAYILYTNGILRLSPDDIEKLQGNGDLEAGQLLLSAVLFSDFKEAKDMHKQEILDKDESFIDRIFPLIEHKTGFLNEDEKFTLTDMYNFVKEKFKNKMRGIVAYDGTEITYLTHLKEVMLTHLFLGENVSVKSILIALGHDLVEDTWVTPEEIGDRFGEEIAFGVKMLSKTPSYEYLTGEYGYDPNNKHVKKAKQYLWKREIQQKGNIPRSRFIQKPEWLAGDICDKVKIYRNEQYLKHLESLEKEDRLYFDPSTLEPCNENTPGRKKIASKVILEVKLADILNNLATLGGMKDPSDRKRKVHDAKIYILPIAKKISSKYTEAISYWIEFWEASFEDTV